MRLGVDLGTTWTAAAIHADGACEAVQLAQNTIAMPSVVAVADGSAIAGDAAERHLAADPAAGAREFKRRLGDSTPYVLDGTPYGAEALMGHLLRHVVDAATKQAGSAPDAVTLTHPANWGEFKLDLLREAGRIAGIEDVELMSEPEAAARHYANLGRLEPGQTVAVFDFGGGTFDAAVVRNGDDGPELLGTPEGLERLGGIDLDHAVLAHVNATLDGQLAELDTTDPAVRRALARLRVECTAAKEALSADTETSIHVAVPGHATEIRIARGELEHVLRQRMEDMLAALGRTVASSGLAMSDLSGVLLVGGSSRMPAVAELVAAATGLPTLTDADPKLVVAAGAAWPRVAESGDGAAAGGTAAAGAKAGDEAGSAAASGGSRDGAGRPATPVDARRERLRRALALGGMTAAAGALVVGGYATYRAWWDEDGTAAAVGPDAAPDEAAADVLDAIFAESLGGSLDGPESLDAFEAPAGFGPPGAFAAPAGGPAPFAAPSGASSGGPSFTPPRGPSASPRPRQHHEPDRPDRPDRPAPRPDRPDHAEPMPMPMPQPTTSAELDSVRMQLRDRVAKLELPDGTDPADAAKLRADLEGLVERFRATPGQNVDDAVASLRYEFEDRVRDFAQDQRIDALVDDKEREDTTGMPTATPTTPATPDAATSGLADVFDDGDGSAPSAWATTTADHLGGAMATHDGSEQPVMPGPKQVPTEETTAAGMGDDVLGTGGVDAAVSSPADPLILTAPSPDDAPTNTGVVPPWLQTGTPAAEEPMNTGVVPPHVDEAEADPVEIPEPLATDELDMQLDPAMDDVVGADPLGVGA